jgi:acetyl-CoA acetyltransferase
MALLQTTMVHELKLCRSLRYGLATLCVGVGQAEATIIEWSG